MDTENSYLIRNSYLPGFSSLAFASINSIIYDFFIKQLPKDYFRKIEIESTSPGMYRDRNEMYKDNFTEKPRMDISYTIDPDEDNTSYARPDSQRLNLITSKNEKAYPCFFRDIERGIRINGPYKRIKISLDIAMIVESAVAQQDLLAYLHKHFIFKVPSFFGNFKYQFEIPFNFVEIMGNLMGLDVSTQTDASILLTYFNEHSVHPIVLHRQESTGITKYFFEVRKDRVMMNITEPSHDKGDKIGRTARDYKVNLSMDIELPIIEDFLLYIPEVIKGAVVDFELDSAMESDAKGVSMFFPSQVAMPKCVKFGDRPGDLYHKVLNIISDVDKESYEGMDITNYFTEYQFLIIKRCWDMNTNHFKILFKVGSIVDHIAQKDGFIEVCFDEECGRIYIIRTDGREFDHTKRYSFVVYISQLLYNMYKTIGVDDEQ